MLLRIEAQGGLLEVKYQRPPSMQKPPPHEKERGIVNGFSKQSRLRLMKLLARLRARGKVIFVTLTYGNPFPTPQQAKADLKAFLMRTQRAVGKVGLIWKMEFQERGAPHFHIVFFGLPFISKHTVQKWWGSIIKQERPWTRIELVRNVKNVLGYVLKYLAKDSSVPAEKEAPVGLSVPHNSTDAQVDRPLAPATGRVWGVWCRDLLPFADKVEIVAPVPFDWYNQFRGACESIWSGLVEVGTASFSLFLRDGPSFLQRWIGRIPNLTRLEVPATMG